MSYRRLLVSYMIPLLLPVLWCSSVQATPETQALEGNAYTQSFLNQAVGHFRAALSAVERASEAYAAFEVCYVSHQLKVVQLNDQQAQTRLLEQTIESQREQYYVCQQELETLRRLAQYLEAYASSLASSCYRDDLFRQLEDVESRFTQRQGQPTAIARTCNRSRHRLHTEMFPALEALKQAVQQAAAQKKEYFDEVQQLLEAAFGCYNQGLSALRTYQESLLGLQQEVAQWQEETEWAKEVVCFPEGTLVWTAEGQREIGHLVRGFDPNQPPQVYACDLEAQSCVLKMVTAVYQSVDNRLLEIDYGAEGKLRVTGNHPIYTDQGYITADEMARLFAQGSRVRVQAAVHKPSGAYTPRFVAVRQVRERTSSRSVKVYNLEVADLENYFVGSVPVHVHNCSLQRMTQALRSDPRLLCGGQLKVYAGKEVDGTLLLNKRLAAGPTRASGRRAVHAVSIAELLASCRTAIQICADICLPGHGKLLQRLMSQADLVAPSLE
ncbi:MAG: Hint domain-containing protein [Zetaproteobacteria bacterium]|nr:Hint domain-containing protein [Zetaproteobacteria bacterium]